MRLWNIRTLVSILLIVNQIRGNVGNEAQSFPRTLELEMVKCDQQGNQIGIVQHNTKFNL